MDKILTWRSLIPVVDFEVVQFSTFAGGGIFFMWAVSALPLVLGENEGLYII